MSRPSGLWFWLLSVGLTATLAGQVFVDEIQIPEGEAAPKGARKVETTIVAFVTGC